MKITFSLEVDEAYFAFAKATRALLKERMDTARALDVLHDADRSAVTLQQWDDARRVTEKAYYAWWASDEKLRKAMDPARRRVVEAFDALCADLPTANPDKDLLIPPSVRSGESVRLCTFPLISARH